MRLAVVAVGQRMPAWATAGWEEFAKRMPPECRLELREVKAEPRSGGKTPEQCMAGERVRLLSAAPKGAWKVVLDERGTAMSSVGLSERLRHWSTLGRDVALFIGGPDGLDAQLKHEADERMRLSDLTLPHAMVRMLLAEALYRAWTLTVGHPYHRD